MKIYSKIAMSAFVVIVVLSVATSAFSWGEVKKAKEFMQAGMYPQAIELLGKRINDKPADADAHFQLGVCFIHTKNYKGADERFGSAVRLQPDYGYKIGGQYQKAGTIKLNSGQMESAVHLYDKAIKYQPNLKNKIAMKCKTTGLQYLKKNKLEEAVKPLKAAAAYQPQLSEEIAKIFFDKANAMINGTAQNKHSGNSEIKAASALNPGMNKVCFAAYKNVLKRLTDPFEQIRILRASIDFADQKETAQTVQIAEFIGQRFKEAKIQKASLKKDLNQLPKNYRLIIFKIAWPPSWKTIYGPVKFTGKGLGNKDWIKTVKLGKDCLKGEKVVIKGDYFEVYRTGGWQKYKGSVEIINKAGNSGGFLGVKINKGKFITVQVEKFE